VSMTIPETTIDHLIDHYDAILLDAYGVLVTHDGANPGAGDLIDRLNGADKPYFILTNDASRKPDTTSRRYGEMGLEIPEDRIITSGLILRSHFAAEGYSGAQCIVLGTEDSVRYVEEAGGRPVPINASVDAEILVVCDERGYPMRETLDHVLSFLYRKLDRGDVVRLVLANPDLVYPATSTSYGFTGGIVARMLTAALEVRYPDHAHRFVPLGKPHPPMFEEAKSRLGDRSMVMIGDQLGTDILGANDFGIDSVLVTTGITRLDLLGANSGPSPTYILRSLGRQA
jgi:HAD superfamily hydrolase (TIGR01450 family)